MPMRLGEWKVTFGIEYIKKMANSVLTCLFMTSYGIYDTVHALGNGLSKT